MNMITRSCARCATGFEIPTRGRGLQHRIYCSRACNKAAGESRRRALQHPPCSVEGCDDKANRKNARLCESHYYRLRRNGHLGLKAKMGQRLTTSGYLMVPAPDHPLANQRMAYQHRVVLYDKIGPGPHPCHWCERELDWKAKKERQLIVDHLDAVKLNNAPDNLVPSCGPCNVMRGAFMNWVLLHEDDPLVRHDHRSVSVPHALQTHGAIFRDGNRCIEV